MPFLPPLALILYNIGERGLSLVMCERALKLDLDCALAYLVKGRILQGDGDVLDALDLYEEALRCEPNNVLVLRHMAVILLQYLFNVAPY